MAGLRKIIFPQTPCARSRQFGTSLRNHGGAPFKNATLAGALSGPRIAPRSASILLQSRFSPAQQARFKSTETASSAAYSAANNAAASPSPIIGSTPLDIDLDAAAFLDMPAQIGYLQAMGIDFGWGTSTMIQWLFEHIHVYSGLPWWASIAVIPIIFRILIFKPALNAAQQQALAGRMTKDPRYVSAVARAREAMMQVPRDLVKSARARQDMARVRSEYNVNFVKTFIPMLQIPVGFGMFRLTRAMAALPVPGMENGGLFWFKDLTIADPFFILPVVSAASMYLMMKTSMKYMPPQNVQFMKIISYAITPVVLVSTIQMSSAVTWMLFVSTTLQIIQNILFHSPVVRRWANLPPLQTTEEQAADAAAAAANTYGAYQAPRTMDVAAKVVAPETRNPWTNMKAAYKDMKEKATDKLSENRASNDYQKAQDYEKKRALEEEEAYHRRRADAARNKTIKDMQREGKL